MQSERGGGGRAMSGDRASQLFVSRAQAPVPAGNKWLKFPILKWHQFPILKAPVPASNYTEGKTPGLWVLIMCRAIIFPTQLLARCNIPYFSALVIY